MSCRSSGSPRNEGYGTRIEHEPERRHDMDGRGGYMGLESPPSYVQNNYRISRDERTYQPHSAYEVEDRFRDRRGREHYDNGRYAPRSAYEEPESAGTLVVDTHAAPTTRTTGLKAGTT